MLKKLGNRFDELERNVLMITLVVMVIIIFTNVVMRYVFNNSLSWSEELARFMFIWFSWMGVSAGLRDGEHLRVELLSTKLIRRGLMKTNESITILVSLIWLATTVVVARYGFEVVSSQIKLGVVSPAMKLPMWVAYLSVPVCSSVIGVRLVVNIIGSVKKLLGKSNQKSEVANEWKS
ncbi:MAG: TRAP transporter small permease [Firmicutes bacterium HGW-Firmicutes-11]|nr:MAG: TRAP transporter small permease [Firmicutes bacterium HGW-Firmicutes-11]